MTACTDPTELQDMAAESRKARYPEEHTPCQGDHMSEQMPTPAYGAVAFPHLHVAMRALAFMVSKNSVMKTPSCFDEEREQALVAIRTALEHPKTEAAINSHDALVAALLRVYELAKDSDSFMYDIQATASNVLSEIGAHPTQIKVAALTTPNGSADHG